MFAVFCFHRPPEKATVVRLPAGRRMTFQDAIRYSNHFLADQVRRDNNKYTTTKLRPKTIDQTRIKTCAEMRRIAGGDCSIICTLLLFDSLAMRPLVF